MHLSHTRAVAFVAMVVGAIAGCHHAPNAAPKPTTALAEDYCWWAVDRTALPVDSVGAHYASAFATLGLGDIKTVRIADTLVMSAGPSVIVGETRDSVAVRVVAFQKGDSTHLRPFLAMRDREGARRIPMCGLLVRTAAVKAVSLHEPDGEEKMSVWTRRP